MSEARGGPAAAGADVDADADADAGEGGRLDLQLAFLLEADHLKQVERMTKILGATRRENSAEHSWHLALFALVLAEHTDDAVDVGRTITMLLLHDLVEIDAGDTFAYDEAAHETKERREREAADRLFGLLPDDQGRALRALWEEFEAGESPEARFANAVDRLQPLLLNHANGGGPWREHNISRARVVARNAPIGAGSTRLWSLAQLRIDEVHARGLLGDS